MNKKIALLASIILTSNIAFAASFSINSNSLGLSSVNTGYSPAASSYTQNIDPATITPANSVSCNAGGLHADNSYMRRFDLDGDHGVTGSINIDSVDIGIETAAGTGGTQPITINLYSIANADALLFANLNNIGTLSANVADASAVIQNFVVTGTIDGTTDDLVVEVFTPDGQGAGHSFFMGSNTAGQIAPSFIAAAACGITEPTDTAAIGFPTMHIVMTINASNAALAPPTPVPSLTWLGLALMVLTLGFFGRRFVK